LRPFAGEWRNEIERGEHREVDAALLLRELERDLSIGVISLPIRLVENRR